MPTIYVDGIPYSFEGEHRNLLEVCLSLGFDLPYFCWHPAMHSVGACRQCAVKLFRDEQDTKGKIVMACMTAAGDGTRLSIDDPEARAFRAGIIEWLMVNHPHDCPVCDEGGECHLQDMTVMTGHVYRRYRFRKRTYRNQYLGPLIHHEMNRCIQCYRCLRFYRDVAGGRDFDVFGWHDRIYFGRFQDGVLENEFSGNLVEVCPTGVFTDATFRQHYTRKWDLQTAPSICGHCGLGCNTIPGERYGMLRRIRNRYNWHVNGYFLCDRGRYGYGYVNSPDRIRRPRLRVAGGGREEVSAEQALERAAERLRGGTVIGIGSTRASLESNFALRALVGEERFYWGVPEAELGGIRRAAELLRRGPAPSASLHEVSISDGVFVLGEDVTNTAPMMALMLRQAVIERPLERARERRPGIPPWEDAALREAIQEEKGPFYLAAPYGTKLEEVATEVYRAAPADLARLGFAVAHALDPSAPDPADLRESARELAGRIAADLLGSHRPLVVSGLSSGSGELLEAAAETARALRLRGAAARLAFIVPECNSLAAGFFSGAGLESAVREVREGRADTVIVMENEPCRRLEPGQAEALLGGPAGVIALDLLKSRTTSRATVLFPAAAIAEGDGTLINSEGRAQRFVQVFVPEGEVRESWRWLGELAEASGRGQRWDSLDEIVAAMGRAVPALAAVAGLAPPAGARWVGRRIPRQPHRYSGRTAMSADRTVNEPPPPPDPDSALVFSMEGYAGLPPAPLIPRYWAPGWNSPQALNRFQVEVGYGLRGGDPGLRLLEPIGGGGEGPPSGAPADGTPDAGPTPGPEGGAGPPRIPPPFRRREDRWWVLPGWHLFGSEELSLRSSPIAELAPRPYLGLHPGDASRLGLQEGDRVVLRLEELQVELPVRLLPRLGGPGLALLPAGLPGLECAALPAWGEVLPARKEAAE